MVAENKSEMKVLLLSSFDIQGGAARAAYRLHQGLRKAGADSQMIVQAKASDNTSVIEPPTELKKRLTHFKPILDAFPLKLYRQRERTPYSLQWFPDKIATQTLQVAPDIINLHWINAGFLQIETLAKFRKPLVWTLHDMWAFTGGCHYAQDCNRYTEACGSCPQLNSDSNWDLSRWIWQRKLKAWKNLNLTIVTPSIWLAKCASASSLLHSLQIKVIPNGLDIQVYKPIDKQLAKKLLGLRLDRQIVLFGAVEATSDRRKGFYLLLQALQKLSQSQGEDQIELVIFGASQPINSPNFGFKTHYLGNLSDDLSLSLVYSAADVFVAPSVQDNLANTVMEALACGTPCVAFKIGGMSDMVEHQQNGYLAHPFVVEDLVEGIVWILQNKQRWQKLSRRARQKIEMEFTLEIQALAYLNLYKNILEE